MGEYDVTTQGEFHRQLPPGEESDWIKFAQLSIVSGKLAVSDPMFFRDLPPPPTFDMPCSVYEVAAKIMTYPDDRRVSRLRAALDERATMGSPLARVGVDFAQVGVFDPVVLDSAAEKMDNSEGEDMLTALDAITEYGVVHLGKDPVATMPTVVSGFGDGSYPIYELVRDEGRRAGVEVIFIGAEVLS
jgi:hypothetical protein